ncbi:hypothetical protein [Planomicrobium sp. YIM 101495]|uniref:hypothetical protein n=1 Tax=Planomicrobium sp. YIM 101495 TaxID=2665160 RepID=UPI0012B6CA6C|nr:hypothetical protein [Planomicrobium sp. YIM 101495]MTD31022.1 hypothetical protein [Planomicrobium sp. YIM 101495]
MKPIFSFLLSVLLLSACSAPDEPASSEKETASLPSTWEEVQGFVIEMEEDEISERILIAEGITEAEALEENPSYDQAIWLTNGEIDFPALQIGDGVTAWWDTARPHEEPGTLTVPAEKLITDQN